MATYSFIDVQAAITGPGGSFSLGYGSGNAEEGISIVSTNEKDTMTVGADGSVMHSLSADKSGTVTVRLLKTSPVNATLQALYDAQSASASLWGQNVITVTNSSSGDITTCRQCAFRKNTDKNYAKEGGLMEWEFNVGMIDSILGVY